MTVRDCTPVYLGLGSNMGDREQNLINAIDLLSERAGTCSAVSPVYTTEPLNPPELDNCSQPDFLNACICIQTALKPEELLDEILTVEKLLGRDRTAEIRWGPRLIDIDILLFGDLRVHTSRLQIPHSQLAERDFVLVPLADIAQNIPHPVSGHTITELLIDHTERNKDCFVTGMYKSSLRPTTALTP